jgi:uncharacterized membrane protein
MFARSQNPWMLAWFVFKENFDRRTTLGMILIMAGAIAMVKGVSG